MKLVNQVLQAQTLTNLRRLFMSLLIICGAWMGPFQAHALTNNHAGAICKNANASESTLINYDPKGTRSLKTATFEGATLVICPLTRNVSTSNGATIFVDIVHSLTRRTSCTAYSFNLKGALLASASQTWTGIGFHEFALNLNGLGKSNVASDYSVLCTIPGYSAGYILGIDVSE